MPSHTERPHLATLVDDFRRNGAQPAVVVHRGNRRKIFTYSDLAAFSEGFAAELLRRRIAAGERVVLWGQNSAEWIGAFFGCVLRGVLVVPLDAAGDPAFVLRVIAETRPRLLVGDRSLLSQLPADLLSPGNITPDLLSADLPRLALEDFSRLLPQPASDAILQDAQLGPDTPLQILFTSGTTSEPKGIVHTHRNILASLAPIEREMQKYLRYERFVHPLRFLHTLPLSHVFGQMMGLWIPPMMAAEVHFEGRLQGPRLLELIRRHRISVLAAVPRVLELLRAELIARLPNIAVRLESARGQSLWRRWWSFRDVHRALGFKFWALVCGGAALSSELESFWRDLGLAVIQGYGMTETAALITLNHPFRITQGSVGKPLPGREVRIGDDGEVLVRGEMVATARWQNGRLQTLPGPWLATGDLAAQDSEGQLHFLGRKSETIVTAAGLNVHPEDVEAALNRQPAVEASAVVPLQTLSGPEPVAVLISRGSPDVLDTAIDAANQELAEYQRVRRWMMWPQLDFPRTALGKIQRHKVAEWVAAQWLASQNLASQSSAKGGPGLPFDARVDAGPAHDPLASLIAGIAREQPANISDEARLDRDFHLDSLGRVQLQAELEQRLGVSISDEQFEQIATLGDLRAGLQKNKTQPAVSHEPSPSHTAPGFARSPQPMPEPSGPEPISAPRNVPAQSAAPAATEHTHARYVYPEWTWWPPVQALRVLFQELVMRPLVWLLAAPEVDRAKFRTPDQPLLLIANHVTAYDPPLILCALPFAMRRKVAIAMAGETLEDLRHGRNQPNWFLNLLAPIAYRLITPLFNVFPLPPSAGLRRSFSHAGWAMDHGYHVLIFPEGVRSRDGVLLPFRAGIGMLARESGARILPVALAGLGELKQRERRWFRWSWFRSGILRIRVGEPIAPDFDAAPEALAECLRTKLVSLLQR